MALWPTGCTILPFVHPNDGMLTMPMGEQAANLAKGVPLLLTTYM